MEMNHDERALHQIEEELGTTIYPGTEIMADVGTHHFVKSSAKSSRVLVPQPSQDPHDPLNWSPFWKMSVMAITTATSFSQGLGPLALAPMFPQLMESFDSDLAGVVQFTGICILVLGFSNFFWIPLQTCYGRRPVLIFSTLICLVSNIWRAVATSYGSYIGACVLNGFGAGPAETSQPEITADIIFLHERGAYNTLYFTAYFGSMIVGPILAGSMAEHIGWRSFFWLNVGLLGLVLILQIVLLPETKWHRAHPNEAHVAPKADQKTNELDPEKLVEVLQHENIEVEVASDQDPYLHRGAPSKQQFKLWQVDGVTFKSVLNSFWIPWKMLTFPIVMFSAFVVSWTSSCFLTLNLTQSQAFAQPPYNFDSQTIGFFNFAILIGAFIGLATNGPFSDWISMRATRKNNGVREPEMRLPAMAIYVVIMIIGNFVVAFGYEYKWDWRIIVIIGYTAAGIQVAVLPAIASTYAVDSYKPVAGSIFVSITVNKNLWGYGFSNFITKWVDGSGFIKPIMMNIYTNMVNVALIGGTGMVGSHILTSLISNPAVTRVDTISRRTPPAASGKPPAKLTNFVSSDTATWASQLSSLSPTPSIFFSAFATTKAAAGGFDNQYKIEHGLNVELAKAAHEAGTKVYVLISAAGANKDSNIAYTRMKGEIEEDIKKLGFERMVILRPGLIAGTREESRPLEAGIRFIANWAGKLHSGLKDGWAQEADAIGKAAVNAGLKALEGDVPEGSEKVWILAGSDIIKYSKESSS
ncbi:hypothetical protein LT330_004518 [Penicillium expansum]|nr:hypothetical protein LT330_004518 [Penicillium expansum]